MWIWLKLIHYVHYVQCYIEKKNHQTSIEIIENN